MKYRLASLLQKEKRTVVIEYGVLITLVAICLISTASDVGLVISTTFHQLANAMK